MDSILNNVRFDAGVQTSDGRRQFSFVDQAGQLAVNKDFKSGFDQFKEGHQNENTYMWAALSAISEQTGLVLYENVKNYIDYVTNVDICKLQSLRSMMAIYGINYRIFDRLDLIPPEVLQLLNIFSINKKYLVNAGTVLSSFQQMLSAENVIYEFSPVPVPDEDARLELSGMSFDNRVIDWGYPGGQGYYKFIADAFTSVISGFMTLKYSENGKCIYELPDEEGGVYEQLNQTRNIYNKAYSTNSLLEERRQYKISNGVPLTFNERSILDDIEAGKDQYENYSGARLALIQMEREYRIKSKDGSRTGRYGYYRRARVLEYGNFVTNIFFVDHRAEFVKSGVYDYDPSYYEFFFDKSPVDSGDTPEKTDFYESMRSVVQKNDAGEYVLNDHMIQDVGRSLAGIALYIVKLREIIKKQTRKNYMKGTYDLMLYTINEFLIDYSRSNWLFKSSISSGEYAVSDLLLPVYKELSAHSAADLTAVEYFDTTEYYNITPVSSAYVEANDRFWENPAGEPLMQHEGCNSDFSLAAIKDFYYNTLGIKDNYISDDNALYSFLNAVYSLGAMDSYIKKETRDRDGNQTSAFDMFTARVDGTGEYTDEKYQRYVNLKQAWSVYQQSLAGNDGYRSRLSGSVSAQIMSINEYIRGLLVDQNLSSVSSVFDAYIGDIDSISSAAALISEKYSDIVSGEYRYYFEKAEWCSSCYDKQTQTYKHDYYIGNPEYDGQSYIYDKIQHIASYISKPGSIVNWPVRDTIDGLSGAINDISAQYVSRIQSWGWSSGLGFTDISSDLLEAKMQYGYSFINGKLADRQQFILQRFSDLKQQVVDLQSGGLSIANKLDVARSIAYIISCDFGLTDFVAVPSEISNDQKLTEFVEYLNQDRSQAILSNDGIVSDYRGYIEKLIELSAAYSAAKDSYFQLYANQEQQTYLSEFQRDDNVTVPILRRMLEFSIEKDVRNYNSILQSVNGIRQDYSSATEEYNTAASKLALEQVLPYPFQPQYGHIETMVESMYDTLLKDVEYKQYAAEQRADYIIERDLYPAMNTMLSELSGELDNVQSLPRAIQNKIKELDFSNDQNYLRQKEIYLTYSGQKLGYYPYFNFKNTVYSSYQVHPFLWNFIKKDQIYDVAKRFYHSSQIDELEINNIADNWTNFFGEFGECKYLDISKQRGIDYSGYRSGYESSQHIANNERLVSEIVGYDGPFYPPAVDYLVRYGLLSCINSVKNTATNASICRDIYQDLAGLDIFQLSNVILSVENRVSPYKTDDCVNSIKLGLSSYFYGIPHGDTPSVDDIVSVVSAGIGEDTFYGRFCRQLKFEYTQYADDKEYFINQLSCYYDGIKDITRDRDLSDVYDIYRYGKDAFGNNYILYKRYGNNQGFKQKRDTAGQLWIRKAEYPVAFPAFYGKYPNVYMKDSDRHIAFVNIADLYRRDDLGHVISDDQGNPVQKYGEDLSDGIDESRMSCIFDFQFTNDMQDITFATKAKDFQVSSDSATVQNYENAWLVHIRPRMETVLCSDIGYQAQVLKLYAPSEYVDYFKSGDDYLVNSRLSDEHVLDGGAVITAYQYIGSYLRNSDNIYHVYAQKVISAADGVIYRRPTGAIKIFPVIGGKYRKENNIAGALVENPDDLRRVRYSGEDVCFSYDDTTGILTFAVQSEISADIMARTDVSAINISANADGACIYSKDDPEMDSHDIFDTNIVLLYKQIYNKQIIDVKSSSRIFVFNTNADISYIPAYPGADGLLQMYRRDYPYYNVELMGRSKASGFMDLIYSTNPSPNPYINQNDISANFTHLRAFEDYHSYVDDTYRIVNNELIGSNSYIMNQPSTAEQTVEVIQDGDALVWRLSLNNIFGESFNTQNARNLKVLVFNKKCKGKNPYVFADINGLSGDWHSLEYNSQLSDIEEYNIVSAADYVVDFDNRIAIASTYNPLSCTGDSNYIYNIKDIKAKFQTYDNDQSADFCIKFELENKDLLSCTFVPYGQMQAVFMDLSNLQIFNYMHYLDAYGTIVSGSGGSMYRDDNDTYVPLSSVQLSDYWHLSDVYVLSGNERLAFKWDEEFRYELSSPMYFYPTLNRKYPFTPAQYMSDSISISKNGVKNLSAVFGHDNTFIFDMEDVGQIKSQIGVIDIPMADEDADYLKGHEDYLDEISVDGKIRHNSDLYDTYDPQSLQFVKFVVDPDVKEYGISAGADIFKDGFEVDESCVQNVDIETALDRINESIYNKYGISGVYALSVEPAQSMYQNEYTSFMFDAGSISNEDLRKILRLYVNYRKYYDGSSAKIELYFNYINYINSPYIRIKDGLVYVDTIAGTYLSLKPGESGILDVLIQFKYYRGNDIYGYKNVKIAQYEICNISDDKPKFVMRRIYSIQRNSAARSSEQISAYLAVDDVSLDTSSNYYLSVDINTRIIQSGTVKYPAYIYLNYPSGIIELLEANGVCDTYEYEEEYAGYVKITLHGYTEMVSIKAQTTVTGKELAEIGDTEITIDIDDAIIMGANGIYADVSRKAGRILLMD